MARGFCLSIGLNSVDPGHYLGWSGKLTPCESDARDVAAIAGAAGLATKVLLTNNATAAAVLGELLAQSSSLSAGDLMVVNYSGHGGQIPDATGREADGLAETLVLFDRMLLDDELFAMWSKFKPGTRILVLSDSCHSGTITELVMPGSPAGAITSSPPAAKSEPVEIKAIPDTHAGRTYAAHQPWYDSLQFVAAGAVVKASVLLISACQDNELAEGGAVNSRFTAKLKSVWASGAFNGDYRRFHTDITTALAGTGQHPNFLMEGAPNPQFEAQRPFTV